MSELTQSLTEHYQKTYELTYDFWKQRNNFFIWLLVVIGAGTGLILGGPNTNSLLVYWIANALGISDSGSINALQKSFPFGLLQLALLALVFYLTVNLYHRTVSVLRGYQYLAALEDEIRAHLKLDAGSVAFTREGSFYAGHHPRFLGLVAWAYIGLLGLLFLIFLGGRIWTDWQARNTLFVVIDVVTAAPTTLYFLAYARVSARGLEPASEKPVARAARTRPAGRS